MNNLSRLSVALVIAVVLVVVGGDVIEWVGTGRIENKRESTASRALLPDDLRVEEVATSPNHAEDTPAGPPSGRSQPMPPAGRQQHAEPEQYGGPSPPVEQSDGPGPAVLQSTGQDIDSVVGRPFPVSESVKTYCHKDVVNRRPSLCLDVFDLLPQFSREPRDPKWAAEMEADLGEIVTNEPGDHTIRVIECRRTLCAMEVVSRYHGRSVVHRFLSSYSKPLPVRLALAGHAISREADDPPGVPITVDVIILRRE